MNNPQVLETMADYVGVAKYSRFIKIEKRRETWGEATRRMMSMHEVKYADVVPLAELDEVSEAIQARVILPSMRAMQFGHVDLLGRGQDMKLYNCCFSICDRPKVFGEVMMNLLCGTGAGINFQKDNVAKLPDIKKPTGDGVWVIADSIEGWAHAIQACVDQYFKGVRYQFDFSEIRPKGAELSSGVGRAPGPDGLFTAIMKINGLFMRCLSAGQTKLRTIDAYDVVMYAADAVRSGGVRRSATIALFDVDDDLMFNAKADPNWMQDNPQRMRSNNSALLKRDDKEGFDKVRRMLDGGKSYGEPGFAFVEDFDHGLNPCAEVGLYPVLIDRFGVIEKRYTGWQFCNLSSVNCAACDGPEAFYEACRLASRIGTLQAGYTDFKYLGSVSEEITRREALIGVSLTGMAQAGEWAFDPEVLKRGAEIVNAENDRVAKMIGINPAARTTVVKPEGTGTLACGSVAHGVHAVQSHMGIRHIQAEDNEPPAIHFAQSNPEAAERAAFGTNQLALAFPFKVGEEAITVRQMPALEQMRRVMTVKRAWIDTGRRGHLCASPGISNNVSNTINLQPDEWGAAFDYVWENRADVTAFAMIGASGDLDYPQAPYVAVFSSDELAKMHGEEAFCEGLSLYGHCDRSEWEERDPNKRTPAQEVAMRLAALDKWEQLRDKWQRPDFAEMVEEDDRHVKVTETVACAGGACTL